MSEALILESVNPQYDNRLFIELRVQYMKIASSEHVVYINCSECQNKNKNQFVYTIVAVGSSGILKGKKKLGVTFNSNKLGGIDFTKFSKLTMCSA